LCSPKCFDFTSHEITVFRFYYTIDTKDGPLRIYYREKNAEEAGLITIYEYRIDENVKILREVLNAKSVRDVMSLVPVIGVYQWHWL